MLVSFNPLCDEYLPHKVSPEYLSCRWGKKADLVFIIFFLRELTFLHRICIYNMHNESNQWRRGLLIFLSDLVSKIESLSTDNRHTMKVVKCQFLLVKYLIKVSAAGCTFRFGQWEMLFGCKSVINGRSAKDTLA